MFRKLKFIFIFTNLMIISVLFVLLTVGAYFLLHGKMINQAEFFSKKLASGVNSGIFPELGPEGHHEPPFENHPPEHHGMPPEPHLLPPYSHPLAKPPRKIEPKKELVFYIKLDANGKIRFISQWFPMPRTVLESMVREVMISRKSSGEIRKLSWNYFYYRAPLLKEKGTLVIFQDLRQDLHIQQSLVIPLIFIGCGYIILAMFGSIFLAQRAVAPIQKAWQQQKDFVGDASHELRTPLAVIQTNLEVVMDNPGESVASQREWLTNIQEELQQMTCLVNSLLFLARVDSRQGILDRRWFDLKLLLERICEAFRPLSAVKGVELVTCFGESGLYYGDESMLRQVVENLLDNAIRHTAAAGKIKVSLEQTGKRIQLEVADTGEGIAAEHLQKIFDRFYQVDSSRSKGKSGLGLAIVKSIVENHGGSIQVTSHPGHGTAFTVHLPQTREHAVTPEAEYPGLDSAL